MGTRPFTAYYIFSDEAGCYQKNRSDNFKKTHPFYLRTNIILSVKDFVLLQGKVEEFNKKSGIPVGKELKWSHYANVAYQHKPRKGYEYLSDLGFAGFKKHITSVVSLASVLDSFKIIFTINDNRGDIYVDELTLIKMHLQDAFQRIEMEIQNQYSFGLFIADDMGEKRNRQLKEATSQLLSEGDFIKKYKHLNKGILMDYSNHNPGLQLADYIAGVMYCQIKQQLIGNKEYTFANMLFESFVHKHIRTNENKVFGYGIVNIMKSFKTKDLTRIFDDKQ